MIKLVYVFSFCFGFDRLIYFCRAIAHIKKSRKRKKIIKRNYILIRVSIKKLKGFQTIWETAKWEVHKVYCGDVYMYIRRIKLQMNWLIEQLNHFLYAVNIQWKNWGETKIKIWENDEWQIPWFLSHICLKKINASCFFLGTFALHIDDFHLYFIDQFLNIPFNNSIILI